MLNRREFLAATGVSAVGAALASVPRFPPWLRFHLRSLTLLFASRRSASKSRRGL